ncbi:MAG: hypothetical protein QXP04_04860 [Candidatus Nanoarchaeia archaeon]|nr:hypothetical protein [Candidatus Jingweiarchaeum tengchongense]
MKKNDMLLIKFNGLDKKEILENMGFEVRGDYVFLNGNRVQTRDKTDFVKVENVKAIVPGSLELITDITEEEDYFES